MLNFHHDDFSGDYMQSIPLFHLAFPVRDLAEARRFYGQLGEQATMFFLDPSGNALEFKAFGDLSQVFAK
jgi:extradiol dioxygenase family protein